jgi:hypothetical protein
MRRLYLSWQIYQGWMGYDSFDRNVNNTVRSDCQQRYSQTIKLSTRSPTSRWSKEQNSVVGDETLPLRTSPNHPKCNRGNKSSTMRTVVFTLPVSKLDATRLMSPKCAMAVSGGHMTYAMEAFPHITFFPSSRRVCGPGAGSVKSTIGHSTDFPCSPLG